MDNNRNVYAVRRSSTLLLALGWISAIISLVRYPFIFGVVGIVLGIIATKNGSRAGLSLIMASIILMAVGMIFNAQIFNFLVRSLGL